MNSLGLLQLGLVMIETYELRRGSLVMSALGSAVRAALLLAPQVPKRLKGLRNGSAGERHHPVLLDL